MSEDNQIESFLSKISPFSKNELQTFIGNKEPLRLQKGEYLLREGQTCRYLYFLHAGVLSLQILKDGEEHIKDFSLSGKFITGYTSLMTDTPSQFYIRAEQDCYLNCWQGHYIKQLIRDDMHWKEFARKMAEYLFLRKEKREISLLLDSAEERYTALLHEFPDVYQQVPQYLIASYLGIKPQSLSRIRKSLAQKSGN